MSFIMRRGNSTCCGTIISIMIYCHKIIEIHDKQHSLWPPAQDSWVVFLFELSQNSWIVSWQKLYPLSCYTISSSLLFYFLTLTFKTSISSIPSLRPSKITIWLKFNLVHLSNITTRLINLWLRTLNYFCHIHSTA